jgi:dienelactone hydrolase
MILQTRIARFLLWQPVLICLLLSSSALAQDKAKPPAPPSAEALKPLMESRDALRKSIKELRSKVNLEIHDGRAQLADVEVFEKAASWMLRFQEFPKADSVNQLRSVLARGTARAEQLSGGKPDSPKSPGTTILGYFSEIDESVQPYAVSLPDGVDPNASHRWPLHVVLHGRADDMNEVNFIHRMDGKPLRAEAGQPEQTWIQLDVYGRGNNAFRWAGETDVFEALHDLTQRFRIDEDRITLHGFSMGGAGAWHLGMHHPHLWSSVGPGAGFTDFYRYQKKNPENPEQRLPEPQHTTLGIYDAVDYALNAFNVPVCTYGGENDPQLLASTSMAEAAAALDVPIQVIIGPKMGHAFDPESRKQFMAFHQAHSEKGLPRFGERKRIRFTTRTLKYNKCDWLIIEEVEHVYEPSVVEAHVNEAGDVEITTSNVRAMRIARDIGTDAIIDGTVLECRTAADGLLPDVYYVKEGPTWGLLNSDDSTEFPDNAERHKRHGLQGPIDDAFMSSFVCIRGTGQPWNENADQWSKWTLERFSLEFAQWMRADVRVIDDHVVDEETIARNHLILFGDPGSNAIIKRIFEQLPVAWTSDRLQIGNQTWPAADHGLSLIFPNPLNPAKYVVLNSGQTFHERDFRASNAWLFPRLGDIAVQKISAGKNGGFDEQTVWADVFDANWKLRQAGLSR